VPGLFWGQPPVIESRQP